MRDAPPHVALSPGADPGETSMQTYGRSLATGFALAFFILCVVGGLAVRSAFLMENASARAADSYQRLRALNGFEDTLTASETAQRAYLLTLDKAYLPPFERAAADTARRLTGLVATPGWGAQAVALDGLEQGVPALVQLYRERIEQRPSMTLDEVTRSVKAAEGRKRMEQLRALITAMEGAESAELDARSAEMTGTTRLVKLVSVVGVSVGLALVAAIGLALQRRLTRTVGGAAVDLTRQARELQDASQLQAGATKETATATVQLTATMHEVQAAAKQIALRSQEVEEIAAASTRAAQAGGQAVDRAKESVGQMRAQIDRVVTQMTALGREVQGAATVLTTIEELAERTNILAINATIEAFAAGEAGDRFQVVAEEIRRLAEKMRGDATAIKLQLDAIMNASNATIMSTEAGFKAVEAGSAQFGEVNAALTLVATRVMASDAASREIRQATTQQSIAAQQLERALSEVNRAAVEADGATQRNLRTAAAMTEMAGRLSALVTPEAGGLAAAGKPGAPVIGRAALSR